MSAMFIDSIRGVHQVLHQSRTNLIFCDFLLVLLLLYFFFLLYLRTLLGNLLRCSHPHHGLGLGEFDQCLLEVALPNAGYADNRDGVLQL